MSNSLEVVACETILQNLLTRMSNGNDPWDQVACSPSYTPPATITFQDIENARAVSSTWKREIDNSPEYACLRLAKWDYDSYTECHWIPKDEYQSYRFNVNWNIFKNSWALAEPIGNERLETASLGELSCCELNHLRTLLSDTRNHTLWLQPGEKVVPRPYIWVSPKHR